MSFTSFPITEILPSRAEEFANSGFYTAADVLLKLEPKNDRHREMVQEVARAIFPKSRTVGELLKHGSSSSGLTSNESGAPRYLHVSTGDAELDNVLKGGARIGSITELTGESGSGKSTLTLCLAVSAGLAGYGTILLGTEGIVSTPRLVELAAAMRSRSPNAVHTHEIFDNLHTNRVADVDGLEHALAFVVPPMLQARGATTSPLMGDLPTTEPLSSRPRARGHKPIRLLILDSITALLRGETEGSGSGLKQRSIHLCSIADRLKALAVEYQLAVVVVNQVSDVFGLNSTVKGSMLPGLPLVPNSMPSQSQDTPPMLYATQARHFSGQSASVQKEAALGIVWANAINTRLMLSRTGKRQVLDHNHGPSNSPIPEDKVLIRRAHLVFSSFAPPATVEFVITTDGVQGLAGSYKAVDLGPAIRRRDLRLREGQKQASDVPEAGTQEQSPEIDELDLPEDFFLQEMPETSQTQDDVQ